MLTYIPCLLLVLLCSAAAVLDVRRGLVPDEIPLALLVVWLASGVISGSLDISGTRVLGAASVLAYAMGAIRGGDTKLLVGVSLFLTQSQALNALIILLLLGALQALIVLVSRRFALNFNRAPLADRRSGQRPRQARTSIVFPLTPAILLSTLPVLFFAD
jgi:Flp pilus assembly protein protease CpaA